MRMANSEVKASPLRNKVLPRLIFRRTATHVVNTSQLVAHRKASGMQSSRRLQLEQATLMVCGVVMRGCL